MENTLLRQRRLSALLGFVAVLLGALGAHGPLHEALLESGRLGSWETAQRYHLAHAVLLWLLASLPGTGLLPWRLIFSGLLAFSGSIYLLCLRPELRWLGPVTPLGGLLLMLGWLALAVGRRPRA